MPDRADGMNHMPRRQPITAGDFGVAGFATAEQRRIRCVHDRVNAERGDVGDDDFQPRRSDQARTRAQAEAAALTVTPLSASSCCSSPAWNISRMMSQPPTNSPLT